VTFTAVLLLVYRLIQTLVPLMLMRLLDLLHVDKDKEQYSYQFVSLRVPHSAPSLYGAAATEDDDYDPAVVQCGERRRWPTSHRTSLPQLRELQLGLRRNRLLRTLWSRGAQCQCLRQDQKYYMQFAPIPLSI